jgi:hypothetical protein
VYYGLSNDNSKPREVWKAESRKGFENIFFQYSLNTHLARYLPSWSHDEAVEKGEDVDSIIESVTLSSAGEVGNGIPSTAHGSDTYRNEDQMQFVGGLPRDQRRLLVRDQLVSLLQLSDEKTQELINTRQITAIRIKGEERFDSRELDLLIETYKQTAQRRA